MRTQGLVRPRFVAVLLTHRLREELMQQRRGCNPALDCCSLDVRPPEKPVSIQARVEPALQLSTANHPIRKQPAGVPKLSPSRRLSSQSGLYISGTTQYMCQLVSINARAPLAKVALAAG